MQSLRIAVNLAAMLKGVTLKIHIFQNQRHELQNYCLTVLAKKILIVTKAISNFCHLLRIINIKQFELLIEIFININN